MITLILFSIFMLIGCYAAGCIPLAFTLSSSKLRYLSIFGAGLLIGTALTVIIPEGVHSMYNNADSHNNMLTKSADLAGERKLMSIDPKIREVNIEPVVDHMKLENQAAGKLVHVHGGQEKEIKVLNKHGHDHSSKLHDNVHTKIGVALITGFIFMLIVDHFSTMLTRTRGTDTENNELKRHSKSIPATIGLVVHAAADGIALGAASSTSHLQLELIVFIAIMLHKAPAAFGLVSFLLNDNVDRNKIRRHLLLFSMAAPIMAIVTYLCLNERAKEHLQDVNATGMALLFSAGTFLYVATIHVLSELSHQNSKSPSIVDMHNESSGRNIISSIDHSTSGFSSLELLFIIGGSAFPLLLSIGHSHE